MLSLGKFPTQVQYNSLQRNPISQNVPFHSKPHLSFPPQLNFHAVIEKMRSELCCNASKTKKKGEFSSKEMEASDEFEDDFGDEFPDIDDDDGELEGDDDEFVVPMRNMKKWVQNKPSGFGEGKEYDTSVEDKLMEEIEQSRKAQLANIDKLKNGPAGTSSKKDKGPTLSPDGFRVRLVNLPKKKNIHKDLRLAFKEVPGIVNIVPVVSGNEKTRDPVCKGIAFVDFKIQDAAQRFIQNFSGKSISFGKVQKQMKCEMVNSKLPNPVTDQSVGPVPVRDSQRIMLKPDEGRALGVESSTSASPLNSSEESTTSEVEDENERHVSGQWEEEEEEVGEIDGTLTISDFDLAEELEVGKESSIDSSSENASKSNMNEKKAAPKRKKDKTPKLNIPGSSKKLMMKDKAVLSGVFSKYGANAVKEQSR